MSLKKKVNAAIAVVAALLMLCIFFYIFSENVLKYADESSKGTSSDVSQIQVISNESSAGSEFSGGNSDTSGINTSSGQNNGVISNPAGGDSSAVTSDVPASQNTLTLNAAYAIVADSDGKIIYAKNPTARCYPASLTKLLTVAVAADYVDEDYLFKVGDEIDLVAKDASKAYVAKGDVLNFKQLTDAVLLPSGNDAAYVMAVGVARAYAKNDKLPVEEAVNLFAELMNRKAAQLGCTGSNFVVPDGYHDPNHFTTAEDMLKIVMNAYQVDIIRNAVCKVKETYVISGRTMTFTNLNKLIRTDSSYYYEGALGLKTGFTDEAGYCLAAVAKKNGKEVFAVIMGAPMDSLRYSDAIAAFNYSFK